MELVSVIITTYGGGSKLSRAVRSALEQDYDNLEVIVVDDNDPNTSARKKTESVMSEFKSNSKVKYIKHEKNSNGAAARNTGFAAAEGEYISLLDDDDYYLSSRIKNAVDFLNSSHEFIGVCYGVVCVNKSTVLNVIRHNDNEELTTEKLLINQNSIGSGSNIFVRKSAILETNGFDESFNRFQDIEFMIRVLKFGRIAYQNDINIVKEESLNRVQVYKKVRDSLMHFISKFDMDINSLSDDDKKSFYSDRYRYLYALAKLGGNRSEIVKAQKELKMHSELTRREKYETKYPMIVALYWKLRMICFNSFASKLFMRIKMKRLQSQSDLLEKQIPKDVMLQIDKFSRQ